MAFFTDGLIPVLQKTRATADTLPSDCALASRRLIELLAVYDAQRLETLAYPYSGCASRDHTSILIFSTWGFELDSLARRFHSHYKEASPPWKLMRCFAARTRHFTFSNGTHTLEIRLVQTGLDYLMRGIDFDIALAYMCNARFMEVLWPSTVRICTSMNEKAASRVDSLSCLMSHMVLEPASPQ